MRRIIIAVLLVLAGLALSLFAAARAEEAEGLWQARYAEPQEIPDRLSNTEAVRFVLLRESVSQIHAPLFSRGTRLTLVRAAGDMSLLLHPGRLVSGGYPARDGDCLVDEESAVTLWGTNAPLGFAVELGGETFRVTGVVRASRPVMAVQDSDFAFTSALLRPGEDAAFPGEEVRVFLGKLSPEQPFTEERNPTGLRFFARLPLWLLLLLTVRRLAARLPRGWRRAATGLAAIAGFPLLGVPNPVSPKTLPTRWSDFSFWPERFAALMDQASEAWLLQGTASDLLRLLELTLPVAACSVLAAGFFVTAARCTRGIGSLRGAARFCSRGTASPERRAPSSG